MVSALMNLVLTPLRIVRTWLQGLWCLFKLLALLVQTKLSGGDLLAKLTQNSTLIDAMSVLRAFVPNLSLSQTFVKSYENSGTALVTRRVDVLNVLDRNADFEVVYGPRMRKLTDGDNFFLGMQPGWDYLRDVSNMRLTVRRSDVAEMILPRATALAERLVSESKGRLDLPPDLTLQVPWDMTDTYFGVGGPDAHSMQTWTTTLFWYLFGDLGADPELDVKSMQQASELRHYLDQAIAERKANPRETDDVLNRCLALQAAGSPNMDDLGIRNNLLGLLIGAIPTLSKATCLVLDELLRRPDALAGAQKAAKADNDALLAQYIWEAFRFNPHNPVIYRRATRDCVVARSTLRQMKVKKGQMVFISLVSAMFDPLDVPAAGSFKTDRPWNIYMHWGYGMHTCFGDAINQALIPAMLKPILQQNNLRRAAGAEGQIEAGGTPFPQHFVVEFEPSA